ncbi:diguanylate cyclase DgcA [Spirochaeta cellobiosiphila]|uniref:diguanylate cyclase DgcA n=1 Tax=Spirochaeta cellobiosiphila TaxID=504483 RepID=UPI00040A25BB|nr:diguanylate cyclase DgcA [Spirochaeta cellobiosiphila]
MDRVKYEDLEKQVYDLKQLLEISKSLNSTLDYSLLIDSILYTCMGQLKVIKAGILTRKSIDNADLVLYRNHIGFDIELSKDYIIPDNHPILDILNKDDQCFPPSILKPFIQENSPINNIYDLNPSIMVPLKAKGIIHGLLILGERIGNTPFNSYEKDFLLNLSIFAAIAVHNAFLFEMTTTDMMTKLKLKHFFLSSLKEKIDLAIDTGGHLSLMMIDIDHFKNFNDTYGHTYGDCILVEIAQIILNNVRQGDIAARYGGEEFAVILPEASLSTAQAVAERIRTDVEDCVVRSHNESLKVTLSIGVAEFDTKKDKQEVNFIDRADKALYTSKTEGRNRTTIAV